MKFKRQFIEGQYGQVHIRVATPAVITHCPLICLHMSPKSGRIYQQFMRAAANDRIIIAPDYPGFGESDPPPAQPEVTIEDYAQSMWEVVDALNLRKIDLLGYHTGSLVAAEAAQQRGKQVGRIVMISAPVFTAAELEQFKSLYHSVPLDEAGTRFKHMWSEMMNHRGPGMTLKMAARSFAENLRAGERYEWGHRAAFAYAPKFAGVVKQLAHTIKVINPADDLAEQTPRILSYLNNGTVLEQSQWGHGFLDADTEAAVRVIKRALMD